MAALSLTSPAKLNLFLHITGRRPDGRHNLQTVFQLLDWATPCPSSPTTAAPSPSRGTTSTSPRRTT